MVKIYFENGSAGSGIETNPLEELYFRSTLGGSFRHYADHVDGATVQFTTLADGQVHCEVEVDAGLNGLLIEASGPSRTSAFMAATENLDRLLFRAVHDSSSVSQILQPGDRLAS